MTFRERFLETLLFGNPNKIPLQPGNGRKSTRETWYKQGLPMDVKDIPEYAYRQTGGKEEWQTSGKDFPVVTKMIPEFEEKVIEKREHSRIVQDWKGNICEISNEYTTEYLRSAIDFVTRRWIKCPVETHDNWEDMKRRYNAEDPARFPKDAKALGSRLSERDWPIGISISGPFWQLREWLGFENLCVMFHDNPYFMKEMISFWKDYIAQILEKLFQFIIIDEVHISEDMAYKGFSMISPAMVHEFLLPTYICWGEIVRNAGCPIYAMDSDGYIGEIIAIWIEAGINVCDPVEVAAGNDIVEYRRRFGHNMAFRGGVDKRAIAKGGKVIEDEIKRLEPVICNGGYIPGCDHAVPRDVSWADFVYYVKLLAEVTGWL